MGEVLDLVRVVDEGLVLLLDFVAVDEVPEQPLVHELLPLCDFLAEGLLEFFEAVQALVEGLVILQVGVLAPLYF
eukprot:CAMPEP_0170510204 /NCGR_PEP_ID=MMETSP0208-20121228/65640_1 /TAXON_ID=197538 /ORGANISM="Strombidium inclinatum, Strain S3" /LENGTH=74 /DNA_ID=CAMNT_0010793653 /DNA_START=1448 /DNA_END=1672 /DNA_ORIENTATION=+